MKIVVVGANGQLGCDVVAVCKEHGDQVVALTHENIEICNHAATALFLKEVKCDVLVNVSAMHNVEKCEADVQKAFAVNSDAVRNLALLSNDLNFTFAHFSTDYVFDGAKTTPYLETDCPGPLNVYGNSKLSGEGFVRSIAQRHFVLRVSALYGKNPCRAKNGLNFIQLMMKLAKERDEIAVVNNEFVSPTCTKDVAKQLRRLLDTEAYGLYHSTSQGQCSWFELAGEIFKLSGRSPKIFRPARPGEFPMKVKRPLYSVLENANLKNLGIDMMPHWREALRGYIGSI